ncbi:hypothetical protein M514_07350, partial [Trichuris suis]
RPDVQARINCAKDECAELRAQWNESQSSDDFKAYLDCIKECVEKSVGSGPFERPPRERLPSWRHPRGPPPQRGPRMPYGRPPPPPPPPEEEEGEEEGEAVGGDEGEAEYAAVA